MADVHVLPGVERRDIGEPVPSPTVLTCAIENGVTDVVIVARTRSGDPYIAAECGNADAVVGKLMRAVSILANSDVEHS